MRRIYSLTRTWTTDDYSAVVDLASDCCRYFTFVIRKSSEAQDALTKLCPFLVCTKEVTEWPGTKLLGSESAQFFKYELNGESAEILKSSANRLWDWSFPQPEDLAFLRADGSPWFASIGHENDAFFKIADEEKDQIEGRFGAGSLKFDCEDELPDEKY